VYYSWRLSRGEGYQHTPLTHGPLQFHMVALSYFLFGDNDFTSRIPAALSSILAIAFIWKLRRYLGRTGTIIAALLMLISPFMLYYGRYVRNEAYVALFGLITIWALLRYLESGKSRYLYWLTAATMLHFTAKETAFIYTAQALLFAGLLFVTQVTEKSWSAPQFKKRFLGSLLIALILIAISFAIAAYPSSAATDPAATVDGETTNISIPPTRLLIPLVLSGLALLSSLYFVIRGYSWDLLRKERTVSIIVVLLTLVLPQLAPFPVRLLGWDPTDYSYQGMIRTATALIPLVVLAVAIGYLWNPRLWLINAAIFYVPFTILYTTIFTNGAGFFTGLVGSLGYWLEQQGVERGNQPWYYYIFIQIPIYEYLPAIGSILALFFGFRIKNTDSVPEDTQNRSNEEDDQVNYSELATKLFGFWIITSIIAYTIAGEKMPWLTVHITLPMILLSGYTFGKMIDRINWKLLLDRQGLLMIILIIVIFISLTKTLGLLFGPTPPFQGKELSQLNATSTFLTSLIITLGGSWGLATLMKKWEVSEIWRVMVVTVLAFLALQTARTAFRAAYINYDNATEYLVYAHSGRGPKTALAQIEELSQKITDGKAIQVAFDDETTYPYWWYLRNYTNQKYFGKSPTRELRDAPVILVGESNYDKLQPVVGQAYYQFDYIRIWWPNQDYFSLTWSNIESERASELAQEGVTEIPPMSYREYINRVWKHIRPFFTNPEVRNAVWQIWYNRDFKEYARLKDKDLSLPNWRPSNRMRLYVRKDIAAQVWNYGVTTILPEEILADPYEGKEIILLADKIIGTNGSEQGQFQNPRNVAIAGDGSLYVADTNNHRIQHLTTDGEVLHVWGSFADRSTGNAPGGTFYEPWGIAVGPEGNVYVVDTWNHRVQKFSQTGEFINQWGYFGQAEDGYALWGPRDVIVDSEGNVFVTDTGNKRVVIYDRDGNYLSEFGGAGLLAGQFDEPVGLAMDSQGQIFVADTWNQRVQVFDSGRDGLQFNPINEWEIVGWYGQSLDNKPYLAVNDQGHVYVSDPEGYRILEFTGSGEFIRYWGKFGAGPDQINLPTGLVFDGENGLWIADAGNHRLLHFTIPEE
ncbi:MAG: glycosyltransferase family 39 protein, partial [Anaerolineales bacterium]